MIDPPMNPELARELAWWQALSALSLAEWEAREDAEWGRRAQEAEARGFASQEEFEALVRSRLGQDA